MRFARTRGFGLGVSLLAAPGLVWAAPVGPAAQAEPAAAAGPGPNAAPVAAAGPVVTSVPVAAAGRVVTSAPAGAVGPVGAGRPEPQPAEPTVRERPRTWQIYQRPLPGAEPSWGPPNGQMPEVAEYTETAVDPRRVPPRGTARIAIGAVVGTLGLGVFGLGIAAQTTDAFGADRRAGVPLIGAGLVTAAIGWGLFTHGILRRRAFLRWKGNRVTLAPAFGGATLILRF